jgi:cytochrome b subunit of formate dehydrogenase
MGEKMNNHIKQELLFMSIYLLIVIVAVFLTWFFFLKDPYSPRTVVRESEIERIDKIEAMITVECVQKKVDDISIYKLGQKVKVWFSVPKNDHDVWECNKIKIKDLEIIE